MIKLNELKHYAIKALGGHTNKEYEALNDVLDSLKLTIDEAQDMITKAEKNALKLKIELDSANNWLDTVVEDNEKLMQENAELEATIEDDLESFTPELKDLCSFYEDKYPARTISYGGYTVDLKGKKQRLAMKAYDHIIVSESMRNWLEEKDLYFKGKYTPEEVSKHAWKVYTEFVRTTKYITDMNKYGVAEQWMPNNVQWYIRSSNKLHMDCENAANMCAALIIESGVPRELVRVTVGDTKLGGHASLTVWDYLTGKFEQWETTATKAMIVKESDNIYIHNVWFSFNDRKSWSDKPKEKYESIKK